MSLADGKAAPPGAATWTLGREVNHCTTHRAEARVTPAHVWQIRAHASGETRTGVDTPAIGAGGGGGLAELAGEGFSQPPSPVRLRPTLRGGGTAAGWNAAWAGRRGGS